MGLGLGFLVFDTVVDSLSPLHPPLLLTRLVFY